jgi:hypothetical protein
MAIVKSFPFEKSTDDGLIVVSSKIGYDHIAIALDTGATHTTVDLTQLLIIGYEVKDAIRTEPIETASGVINTLIFNVSEFSCLGIKRRNFEISAYDFLFYGIVSEFDGVLGLDFFKGVKFCIDMENNVISIQDGKS